MTRYVLYSSLIHFLAAVVFAFIMGRSAEPTAYYGFQFLGGQSGFGSDKLEPAPAPTTAAPPAPISPEEAAPASDDPNRVAVAKEPPKKSEPKPKTPPAKTGVKGGRGESALGRGDFQGSKTGPVGGVGTSLEIGGFGPGGGGDASKQFPFKWYGELIYKRLWEAWDRTDAGTRECKVGFVVQRDGSVKSVKIKASSGDSLFDMTAKRAVTAAAPFPPLPDGFKEKELPVLVRFRLQ